MEKEELGGQATKKELDRLNRRVDEGADDSRQDTPRTVLTASTRLVAGGVLKSGEKVMKNTVQSAGTGSTVAGGSLT